MLKSMSGIWLRKLLLPVIGIAAALAPQSGAEAAGQASLQQVFSRPLIIGASVSAGTFVSGPGTIATRSVMGADTSTNLARNGAEGWDFAYLTQASLAPYSLVIGVDLFFWDSTKADVSASTATLAHLIRSARAARVPLVLGDIPALDSRQVEASRIALNRRIHSYCRAAQQCYVLGIDNLHRIAATRGLVIGGRLYHFSDLSTDNIHLNETGSSYLAGAIIGLMRRR